MLPDHPFRDRRAPSDVDDQARHQAAQVESAIESVGKGGEVVNGVLSVFERVVGASQRGLEVAQHGVHPKELRQISRLAVTDDDRLMSAVCGGDGCEATQTVADDCAAWGQRGFGPLADGLGREAADQVEFQESGPVLVVQRHGGHERHLVLRTPARLTAGTLATEVGVVNLHDTLKLADVLARRHGAVDLVVQQPGGRVAHAKLALHSQRGQAGLGLADQVDRQEPGGQRQLGVFKQAASGQRGLMPAANALEQTPSAVANHVVRDAAAAWAAEAAGPTGRLQRLGAVRLSAKAAKELGQRHAGLELDSVEGHQVRSVIGCTQVTRPKAHQMSLAEAGY